MTLSIRLSSVSYSVKGKTILKDISFEANPERNGIIGILGPSGSGKSTVLRLINGLISPTAGNVIVGEKEITDWDPRELRKTVGMVLQRPFLFPGTIRDNLEYGPGTRGVKLVEEKLTELLVRVGLDQEILDKNAGTLSGGEQQRVSVARTLANKPDVLLLDEPTSALDVANEETLEEIFKQLKKEKKLLFLVSHDPDQTKRLCDRVMIINQGKLDKDMPAVKFFEIYDHSSLREYFRKHNQTKEK
ncbi:MAG: ATP-binding cassette domain-containing protein [Candidatus Odinarchaeota archaeon]